MPFEESGGATSFVTKKLGPMPVWAWGLVGLGAAVAYASWKKNKATAATTSPDPTLIGGDQTPPVVFQSYTTVIDTDNDVPPGAGRPVPPVHVPVPPLPIPGRPPRPLPPPVTVPAPTPRPAPTPPAGQWVPIVKYTSTNPPWNSTLWGIAQHFGYGSSSTNYAAIWNAPQNAALVARRKAPTSIQAGDSIFVPAKS